MRIGINLTLLQNSQRFRGKGTYTRHLLDALMRNNFKHNIIALSYENKFGIRAVPITYANELNLSDNWRLPLTTAFKQQIVFPIKLLKEKIDIFHEPMESIILHQPLPTLITFHDAIPKVFPKQINARGKLFGLLHRYTAHKAAKILTVSESSKKDLINYYHLPSDKIRVTYLATEEGFAPINDRKSIEQTLAKFNIHREYILYVGGLEPHKNLDGLLKVFAQFNKKFPQIKLVITGKSALNSSYIKNQIKMLDIKSKVVLTGFVEQKLLPIFYSGALFYFSLSLYEGFGLPFLEALSCGTTVVGYKVSSIPEVVGNAGLLLPLKDRRAVLQAMEKLVTDESLRKRLAFQGVKQAKKFSWDRCAKTTLEVYDEIEEELRVGK